VADPLPSPFTFPTEALRRISDEVRRGGGRRENYHLHTKDVFPDDHGMHVQMELINPLGGRVQDERGDTVIVRGPMPRGISKSWVLEHTFLLPGSRRATAQSLSEPTGSKSV
jgi:hypothetical protein